MKINDKNVPQYGEKHNNEIHIDMISLYTNAFQMNPNWKLKADASDLVSVNWARVQYGSMMETLE